MRLYDLASVIRSKNAGPFTLTIDLLFENTPAFHHALQSSSLTPAVIATHYGVRAESVQIHAFERIRAIKITLPRTVASGAPGDVDVYGSQQHFPLGDLTIDPLPAHDPSTDLP